MAEEPHEREEAARQGVEEVAAEAGLCLLPSTLDMTPHVGNLLLREDLLASPPAHDDPTVSIPLTQEELAANQAAIRTVNNQAGCGSPTMTNTAPTSDSSTGGMKKRKASPVTTARQQRKKTKAEERIKIGCRVKIQKKNLFHLLVTDQQKESLKGFNQNYNCYGTIKSGNAAAGYRVAFDNLPYEDKEVFVKRKKLTAVGSGNEETPYDKNTDNPEVLETIQRENRSKKSTIQASIDEFCSLDEEVIADAKTLDIRHDEHSEEKVSWKILPDNGYTKEDDDPMVAYPKEASFSVDIDFGEVDHYEDLKEIFFEHFFPDVVGKAQWIDDFHSDPRSTNTTSSGRTFSL
ncbi:hypothetical protein IV203_013175 [Nitzschia inconspicua]|uniref:Uncharacterized protein n=1 Tax=Nitzschia inconspicua TaxID=303405 RepID=A0A9K3Q8L9_9STRA|nr:hypothetical protein IV203_013175 [Nitzschia inconspicua]